MFNQICDVIRAHMEFSFQSFIFPIIMASVSIALLWIVMLLSSLLIKKKAKKWHDDPLAQGVVYKKFIVHHGYLLRRSMTAFRWIGTVSIFSFLCAELLRSLPSKSAGIENLISFFDNSSHFLISVFFVVLVAIWTTRLVQHTMSYFILQTNSKGKSHAGDSSRKRARSNTLTSVTGNLLKIMVTIIAAFTILQNMGINIAALLATAGIASVAFGFGAQTLVKDFISGFYILFEDQFAVGDQVEINSFSGVVESMTLRMVRLRSQEGSFVLIPNGDIRAVKNFTTDWARVDFRYSVPLTADLDKATKIIFEEVERIKKTYAKDILGTPEIRPVEKIVDFENRSTAALFRVFIKTHSIASKLKIEMDLNKGVMSQHVSLLQNSLPSQKQ